jgi:hypothetical protein
MHGSSYMFRHYIAIFNEWIIGAFDGFPCIFLLGILIVKDSLRDVFKSFGVKGLI